MTVDLSGLPEFPDTGALRSDATAIHDAGKAFKDTADDARSSWREIAPWVVVPDETSLVNAFDKPQEMGEGLEGSTEVVKLALHQYCDDLESIKGEYDAAVSGGMACYSEESDAQEAQDAVNGVAEKMLQLEEDCANNIKHADPGAAPAVPWSSPYDGMVRGAVTQALGQLRVPTYDFRFSAEVRVRTLDYSRINIAHADGTIIPAERIVLTETTIRADGRVRVPVPTVETQRFGNLPDVPPWLRKAGHFIPGVDYVITGANAFSQEWNDDLEQHPEMNWWERVGSAGQSAGLRVAGNAVGNVIGTAGGIFVGALAGGASLGSAGAAAGSVVPVAGNIVGGGAGLTGGAAIGAIAGGYAGGTAGGLAGENLGAMLDNALDGEDASWGTAWEKVWG